MAIADKTRKLLWGRSGNRCSICRLELIIDATMCDDASLVGEECHIISGQRQGPRHDPSFAKKKIDSYDNLLLLCRVHHKMVDDQHETYTIALLKQIKNNHEKWVAEKLMESSPPPRIRIRRIKENILPCLVRMTSGKDVLNLTEGTSMLQYDHDELTSSDEAELVGGFIQTVRDWGDMGADLEPIQRARIGVELTESIKEIEKAGFYVFGGKEVHRLEGGTEPPIPWSIGIIQVLRNTNGRIVSMKADQRTDST